MSNVCERAPEGYDVNSCIYQKKNCRMQCLRESQVREDKTPKKIAGRWINRMPLYPSDVVKKCSNCGFETDTWRHCNVCPGCGIGMEV